MKRTLKLGKGLSLPLEAVTETFGFMARRRAGKTYCAQKLAEEMMEAGAQIVVLDPIGKWWSLRLAADGKSKCFEIPVFGGQHGDIPLSADAGKLVADTVADTGTSVVLDVAGFSKKNMKRFVADFCERLFRRRYEDSQATHVFFEECQTFCPQRVSAGDARMVGAVEDIVRKGRSYGLGATMISQRPQSVNKEIFNQVECLFMMQMNGPHERATMKRWIDYKGVDASHVIDELPLLEVGEAWVSSPQLLKTLKKVKIGTKKSYDATAAPKVGAKNKAKRLAKLDMKKLEKAMETVVEKRDANDPSKLRRQVVQLEKENASLTQKLERGDGPKVAELERKLRLTEAELDKLASEAAGAVADLERARERLTGIKPRDPKAPPTRRATARTRTSRPSPPPPPPPAPRARNGRASSGDTASFKKGAGQHRMLVALAQFHPDPCSDRKMALLAELSRTSGTFSTYLGRLRKDGLVDGERDALSITDAGLDCLGNDWSPLPTGDGLRDHWLAKFQGGKRRMLEALFDVFPHGLGKEDLAHRSDLTSNSGTFSTYLGKLRTLELVEGRNPIRASSHLFEDA